MSRGISKIVNVLTLNRRKKPKQEADATVSSSQNILSTSTTIRHGSQWEARQRVPLPFPPPNDFINQHPYFHPQLGSKEDVQNFMSQYSLQEGYFIIRRSFKSPNSYTITVNHHSGLKHLRVIMKDGRFSLNDRLFETIDGLIQFYSYIDIPNEENIPGILLKFPIRRPIFDFGVYVSVDESKKKYQKDSPELISRSMPANEKCSSAMYSGNMNVTSNNGTDRRPVLPPRKVSAVFSTNHSPSQPSSPTESPPQTSSTVPSPTQLPQNVSAIETCDCGLAVKDTVLPKGWSIHISSDPGTKDYMFFQSPTKETCWDLPLTVSLLLTPEQQHFIRSHRNSFDASSEQLHDSAKHPIQRPCLSKFSFCTTNGDTCNAATSAWVPWGDYESLKSLTRLQQPPAAPPSQAINETKGTEEKQDSEEIQDAYVKQYLQTNT